MIAYECPILRPCPRLAHVDFGLHKYCAATTRSAVVGLVVLILTYTSLFSDSMGMAFLAAMILVEYRDCRLHSTYTGR